MEASVDIVRRSIVLGGLPAIGTSFPLVIVPTTGDTLPSGSLVLSFRLGPATLASAALSGMTATIDLSGAAALAAWLAAGNPYSADAGVTLADVASPNPTVWATGRTVIIQKPWTA